MRRIVYFAALPALKGRPEFNSRYAAKITVSPQNYPAFDALPSGILWLMQPLRGHYPIFALSTADRLLMPVLFILHQARDSG
jgi:hypothetical protein